MNYFAIPGVQQTVRFIQMEKVKLSEYQKMAQIIHVCCRVWGITIQNIKSKNRRRKYVEPRQAALYLGSLLTNLQQIEVVRSLGKNHHSMLINSTKKAKNLIETDPQYRERFRIAKSEIEKII